MVDINQIPTRRPFHRRRKTCPFSGANAPRIDYKDVPENGARFLGALAEACDLPPCGGDARQGRGGQRRATAKPQL